MAVLLPVVAPLVAQGIATAVVGTTILGVTIGAVGAAVIGGMAGMAVSGILTSAFTDKPDQQQATISSPADAGFLVNTGSTAAAIPVVYGFRQIGCAHVLKHVAGPNNEYLYLICVACEGEIGGFEETYLDGVPISDPKFVGMLAVEYHVGTEDQAASEILLSDLPDMFDANDTGVGIAYAVLRLKRNPDLFPNLPEVRFDIRGKLLFDYRDGQTKMSNNPSLAIRDYWTNSRYGRGVPGDAINTTSFAAEADYFDEFISAPTHSAAVTVADPATDTLTFADNEIFDNRDGVVLSTTGTLPAPLVAGDLYYVIRVSPTKIKLATTDARAQARNVIDLTDSGTGTHTVHHDSFPRFTCDGAVDVDNQVDDNLRKLRSSCRSWLFMSAGQYKLVCDKPTTPHPSFAFSQDNMVGEWQFRKVGKEGRFNRVRSAFYDPLLGWQRNFITADSSTDRAADGCLLQANLELDFTTNAYRAQMICELERRKSRLTLRASQTNTLQAFRVECADVVNHTHPLPDWEDKPWRILRMAFTSTDMIKIDMTEYGDIWTGAEPGAAFTLPKRTNLPNPADYAPPIVGGLELVGGGLSRVFKGLDAHFTWYDMSSVDTAPPGSEPFGGGGDKRDPWFKDYLVRVLSSTGVTLREEPVETNAYDYTFQMNMDDARLQDAANPVPEREVEILVWARTRTGRQSAVPARLKVSNPQPAAPTGGVLTATFNGFTAVFDAPGESDIAYLKVWASLDAGEYDESNVVFKELALTARAQGLLPNSAYHVWAAFVDTFSEDDPNIAYIGSVTTLRADTPDLALNAASLPFSASQAGTLALYNKFTGSTLSGFGTLATSVLATLIVDMNTEGGHGEVTYGGNVTIGSSVPDAVLGAALYLGKLEYAPSKYQALGSCSIDKGTSVYGGSKCLLISYTGALSFTLDDAETGTSKGRAIILGQHPLRIDAVRYSAGVTTIYATPLQGFDNDWLLGAGTYPVSKSVTILNYTTIDLLFDSFLLGNNPSQTFGGMRRFTDTAISSGYKTMYLLQANGFPGSTNSMAANNGVIDFVKARR